jgi:hypothetical protein
MSTSERMNDENTHYGDLLSRIADSDEVREAKSLVGIDPGLSGGIVFLPQDGVGEPKRFVMPVIEIKGKGKVKTKHEYNLGAIRQMLVENGATHVFVEKQQPMTKPQIQRCGKCGTIVNTTQAQGIISTFQTGRGFGLLEGLLAGMQLRYTIVAPQSWQPKMLGGIPGADSKAKARVVAGQLFPGLDLRANDRCRVPHEGITDALLIAVFGERILGISRYVEDPELGF